MTHPKGAVPRRPAFTDLAPSKRHDGSLDGYRRQRRPALLQRHHAGESVASLRDTGRSQ